jgi:hypothetical protein
MGINKAAPSSLNIIVQQHRLIDESNALRELQAASGQEWSALMLSILDRAFKGDLCVH